jgi:predicted metal-binding transcription factor (methanogenesis marker protein 9)
MIAAWCESGTDPKAEIDEAISKLGNCDSAEELTMLKDTLSDYVVQSPEFKKAGNDRYTFIKSKNAANVNA